MALPDRRRPVWVVGAVSTLLLMMVTWHGLFSAHPSPRLLTSPAKMATVDETVLASGTIQPYKLVSVGAQASGRILALHVGLGDHVVKGQSIAEIDPSTERNALEIAEATLEQDRAQRASRAVALTQAKLAFKRAATTYAQQASSQADYEAAQATYEGAKADVAALDAQIRQATLQADTARVTLAYTKVIAPMDGTVVAIVAPEGQTVNAVQAAPTIVKLADLDTMTVKAQISEADVMRVHPGDRVYFTVLGAPDHRYYATLRALEPAPESMSKDTSAETDSGSQGGSTSSAVYYNGLFDIPNPRHELRPAMTAQVTIILRSTGRTLTIPVAALGVTRPDGRTVIRVVDSQGRVETRLVHVGIRNSTTAQILDGLAAGEHVVIGEQAPKSVERPTQDGIF